MQPPGDPDMVAGVKGLYAGLLEKVEFTILQLSNWNLLNPELIRNEKLLFAIISPSSGPILAVQF